MKKELTFSMLSLLLCCSAATAEYGEPISKVALRVVDTTGAPVTNASVRVASYWRPKKIRGTTNTNGVFRYEDKLHGEVNCYVDKPGWYHSGGEAWHRKFQGDYPTQTLTVVLKRIVDPVLMVDRTVETHLPRLDVPVGFDFVEGDWVAPDGKGSVADVWMTGTMRFVSRKDHEIRVHATFSNVVDGVQEFAAVKPDDQRMASDLMPPQVAPPDGYARELTLWQSCEPGGWLREHDRQDRNYLFRIRTRLDENGEITAANYGWTYGEIALDSEDGKRIWMRLRYYYNPDPHSRSLEPKSIADQQNRKEP